MSATSPKSAQRLRDSTVAVRRAQSLSVNSPSLNFVKEFRRFLGKNRLKSAQNQLKIGSKSAKIG